MKPKKSFVDHMEAMIQKLEQVKHDTQLSQILLDLGIETL